MRSQVEVKSRDHGRLRPNRTTSVDALIDIQAVAEFLGITTRHVQRLVAERRIPFLKMGRFVRFDPRTSTSGWTSNGSNPSVHRFATAHPGGSVESTSGGLETSSCSCGSSDSIGVRLPAKLTEGASS
jgi:excisionase family DNA binding protein